MAAVSAFGESTVEHYSMRCLEQVSREHSKDLIFLGIRSISGILGGYIRDERYANGVGWCILGEKLDKERESESGGKVQTWKEGVNLRVEVTKYFAYGKRVLGQNLWAVRATFEAQPVG